MMNKLGTLGTLIVIAADLAIIAYVFYFIQDVGYKLHVWPF